MTSFEIYFNKLNDMLHKKDLINFWILPERSDFKPIKNVSKKKMQQYLRTKPQYYNGKKIANVNIVFKPGVKFDKITPKEKIFFVKIFIYIIDEEGKIDYDDDNEWMLMISYTKNDLNVNHFTLKELNQMIKETTSLKISSDIGGITYATWINHKKKIKRKSKHKTKK